VEQAVAHRDNFVREAWVGARVSSPWIGRVIELPPGRQSSLYIVMPRYRGQLLTARIAARPAVGLEEGRGIAIKLCHGVAALHRAGVIHRDIKPDNIILEKEGSLKLLDLGVVRLPGLEDEPPKEIPGTAAYMAPEMFEGEPGNEQTDIYALGVTVFRALTGEYPYGNPDATSRPRLDRPKELSLLRPDLPAWLEDVVNRAIAVNPERRYRHVIEFAEELEAGPVAARPQRRRAPTAYERYKLQFWQGLAALLALGLVVSLVMRH
jgi:serine/threonine protein kinase